MSKAIDDLKHEHEAILSALKILDTIVARISQGSTVPKEDVLKFIGFLKEFADKCHHGKEEGILFPALVKAGIPEKSGPIGVMLSEHADGRNHIKDMEGAIADLSDNAKFSESATAYFGLLKNHIQKENNVLFPIAEKALPAVELERLYKFFEEHEEKIIGQGRHEELHRMLDGLKQKYLT